MHFPASDVVANIKAFLRSVYGATAEEDPAGRKSASASGKRSAQTRASRTSTSCETFHIVGGAYPIICTYLCIARLGVDSKLFPKFATGTGDRANTIETYRRHIRYPTLVIVGVVNLNYLPGQQISLNAAYRRLYALCTPSAPKCVQVCANSQGCLRERSHPPSTASASCSHSTAVYSPHQSLLLSYTSLTSHSAELHSL